jgi:hypothetical protein
MLAHVARPHKIQGPNPYTLMLKGFCLSILKKISFRKGMRESLFIKILKAAVKIKNLSNIQKQHNNMKNHNNFKSKI